MAAVKTYIRFFDRGFQEARMGRRSKKSKVVFIDVDGPKKNGQLSVGVVSQSGQQIFKGCESKSCKLYYIMIFINSWISSRNNGDPRTENKWKNHRRAQCTMRFEQDRVIKFSELWHSSTAFAKFILSFWQYCIDNLSDLRMILREWASLTRNNWAQFIILPKNTTRLKMREDRSNLR